MDRKQTWSVLGEVLGRARKNIVEENVVDGRKFTDCKSIAVNFNGFFSTKGSFLTNTFVTDDRFQTLKTDDLNHNHNLTKLTSRISSLKISSGGCDNIPMTEFNNKFDILGPSVTNIFNHSLVEGVFPNQLKIVEVTPNFKAGTKSITNNYRPISILPAFSKF